MKITVAKVLSAILVVSALGFGFWAQAYPGLGISNILINEEVWKQTNDLAQAALRQNDLANGRIVQKDGRDFLPRD